MPKYSKQKLKILYIAQMLLQESDEIHPIPMQEILSMLEHNGILSERKSLYDDISALNDFGMDVNYTKENGRGYYIGRRRGRNISEKFDMAAYSKKTFGMFAGTEENVTLLSEEYLTGVCIDRFGTDIFMHKTKENKVHLHADVAVSPQFFGGLAGLGTGIAIESPQHLPIDPYISAY